jgi:hypothetical protein
MSPPANPGRGIGVDETTPPTTDHTAKQNRLTLRMLSAASWPADVQPTSQGRGTEAQSYDSFFGFVRTWGHTGRPSERRARCIRHASPRAAFPVGPLTVAVIETAFRAVLMATVGTSALLAKGWEATVGTAIPLTAITGTTDSENRIASAAYALPKNNLAQIRHPGCQVGLDKDDSSWQGRYHQVLDRLI